MTLRISVEISGWFETTFEGEVGFGAGVTFRFCNIWNAGITVYDMATRIANLIRRKVEIENSVNEMCSDMCP
jgi:hypothetical protein